MSLKHLLQVPARSSAAVLTAGAAALSGVALAAPAQAAPFYVEISPQSAPGKAIADSVSGSGFGNVVLRTDSTANSQRWEMKQVANLGGSKLAFNYINKEGGCLDVANKSRVSGVKLVVAQCDGSFSQQWIRDFSVNTTFLETQNRNSGLFMTADSTTSGTELKQRVAVGSFGQFWSVFGADPQ
ncbi:RICIN domain-containing protein [Streptomyces sp. HC44]|uniref:RICIN domain-containing protein n=1 Tax=Streptomyces scabichelini TaxID=2711217 RepID=A0A6G4VBJ7_9ACTN|nr:RICIN domain-containing protein [Streptomyces scabichelini]NGO11174.1 RICIN domain-containing protein [Streptomyces scabichelini]